MSIRARALCYSVAFSLGLVSCASITTLNVSEVQSEFSQALQSTNDVVGKSQTDYREKNLLFENLKRGGTPGFQSVEGDLRHQLERMKSNLAVMEQQRRKMSDANSQIAALAYTSSKIGSHEPAYAPADQAIREFESATVAVNAAAVEYERASHSFADSVTAKKLYFNFDVEDFQKRLEKSIHTAQRNQKNMRSELERSQAILNNSKPGEELEARTSIYNEMSRTAHEYSNKAGTYAELGQEIRSQTMDRPRISSLDPNWPEIQRKVMEFDQLVRDLDRLNEAFVNHVKRFRDPSRSKIMTGP
ncbi:MAG: hypothetical protein AB7G93_07030 [Bdellovibrionales bacterium]